MSYLDGMIVGINLLIILSTQVLYAQGPDVGKELSCLSPTNEASAENSDETERRYMIADRSKRGGGRCMIAADVNAKVDAWGAINTTLVARNLEACLERRGALGKSGNFRVTLDALHSLQFCQREAFPHLREFYSRSDAIGGGVGTPIFDRRSCKEIAEALNQGGGAVLSLGKNGTGHANNVVEIDCPEGSATKAWVIVRESRTTLLDFYAVDVTTGEVVAPGVADINGSFVAQVYAFR